MGETGGRDAKVVDLARRILSLSIEERADFYRLAVASREHISPGLLSALHTICAPGAVPSERSEDPESSENVPRAAVSSDTRSPENG